MANGQQGLRTGRDEQDFIRRFVNDPGPITISREEAAARPRQPGRARRPEEIQVPKPPLGFDERLLERGRRALITMDLPEGGFAAERLGETQQELREADPEYRRQAARAALAQENAAAAEARAARASRPGLRVTDDNVGPPSGRQFEFNPGPGRGLRGEIELERPNAGFEQRVRESVAAGAFDPVTPERVESARQVHQANVRALRGLRQLAAARRGVPEQFLDAVRQGNITGREAVMLGAQQPVARGGGGLTGAQLLNAQQREREQGLRERRFSFDQAREANEMLTDEEAPVRREGRRQAAALYATNPNDPIAQQTMARAATRLLNDLGNPGMLSYLWFDLLGGSPQGILDPDTRASVQDTMTGQGFSFGYGYRGRGTSPEDGKPVLLHRGNPVDEWEDVVSADPDVAAFLLDAMGVPARRQRGLRPR